VQFEWDEDKNTINLEKHGIAFSVAVKVFENEFFTYKSSHSAEMRHIAVGEVSERIIAVVYTYRYEKIRIISARRARKKEEKSYRALHGG
jgi:uncharacterized DUF497 family protein